MKPEKGPVLAHSAAYARVCDRPDDLTLAGGAGLGILKRVRQDAKRW
jgi:hypothetical protein